MAKPRITKMTPEQKAKLPEFREAWRANALRTDAIDPDEARRAVRGLYEAFGKARPAHVVCVSSPMAMHIAGLMLRGQLGDQLGGQLGGQLGDQLRGQLGDQLRDQLWGQLWDQLWGQLGDQLWGQLRGQLRDQLGGQLGDQLWGQLGDQLGGGADAYWFAFYEFQYAELRAALSPETRRQADAYRNYITSAGLCLPFEGIALVADRPEVLRFDDRRLLHCEDGPAIRYRDGWSVYAWHGTRVPSEWIEDSANLDPKTALTWENLEQRRCAAEIIGWDRALDQLSATTIDTDGDPEIGTLVEVDLPDIGRERFLRVRCGTGRNFALPVPPDMPTALAAQAWTFGFSENEFIKPEVRT